MNSHHQQPTCPGADGRPAREPRGIPLSAELECLAWQLVRRGQVEARRCEWDRVRSLSWRPMDEWTAGREG